MVRPPVFMDSSRRHHASLGLLIAFLLLSVRTVAALDVVEVGKVAEVEGSVEIGPRGALTQATRGTPINLGDLLQTGPTGAAEVNLGSEVGKADVGAMIVEEKSPVVVSSLSMRNDSSGQIVVADYDPHGPKVRFFLRRGTVLARIKVPERGVYEVGTDAGHVVAIGTAFLVTYCPSQPDAALVGCSGGDETMVVLGASGTAQVAGLVGAAVSLDGDKHEITTVKKGEPPTPPQPVSEEQFRQYIEGLEFIGGGRAESQTVGDPLRNGKHVPQQYQISKGVAPPVDTLDPCPRQSAPSCMENQPVEGLGNLDIRF
jgi:hypothetical protein